MNNEVYSSSLKRRGTNAGKMDQKTSYRCFNLYCKIPFQKAFSTNPDILETAKIIGRSPNSVKMKIGNFGSFDPELKRQGIVGLDNTSKLDQEIWDEFNNDWETLSFESERLIKEFKSQSIEASDTIEETTLPEGMDKEQTVKARINQSFFRSAVLSAYNNTCCITGLSIPNLLIASHIKPWKDSDHATERTNLRNNLCFNALHDKAFDIIFIISDCFGYHQSTRIYAKIFYLLR